MRKNPLTKGLKVKSPEVTQGSNGSRWNRTQQTRPGEMFLQSKPESEGDEVSAIANDSTRKQVPGRRAETDGGDGTDYVYSTSL